MDGMIPDEWMDGWMNDQLGSKKEELKAMKCISIG